MGNISSEERLRIIIEGLQEKKAKDLISLSFAKLHNPVCKYFVICHGDSSTHVKAIADTVEEYVREHSKDRPWQKEGFENSQWIILDYGDTVIHVFLKEFRDHYRLEELWADAEAKSYE